MEKQDEQKSRKLREPLDIGEKVLFITERLKRKVCQVFCIRARPETNQ